MLRVCKDADLCKWVYYEIGWRSLGCIYKIREMKCIKWNWMYKRDIEWDGDREEIDWNDMSNFNNWYE